MSTEAAIEVPEAAVEPAPAPTAPIDWATAGAPYPAPADSSLARSTHVVFLSLYLILLAFFMMLNTQAEISSVRVQAVVAGLGLPLIAERTTPRPMALVADELESRLADVLARELGRDDWSLVVKDGVIEIAVPLRRVFEPGTVVLQTTRVALMRRLGEALVAAIASDGLQLSVALDTGTDAALARRRAAALGRDLVRQGVAATAFAVTVEHRDDDAARWRLRREGER